MTILRTALIATSLVLTASSAFAAPHHKPVSADARAAYASTGTCDLPDTGWCTTREALVESSQ